MESEQQNENSDLISALIISTNSISLIAIILVLIAYFRYPILRVAEFNYIMFICLADVTWSILMIIVCLMEYFQFQLSYVGCQFQAFVKCYSGLVEFYWTAVVCFTLKQNVFDGTTQEKYYKFWLIMCFSFPFYFALIPLLNNTYGYVYPMMNVNCFISTLMNPYKNERDWTLFGCFYIQLWLIFIYNLYCVITIVVKIKNELGENEGLREQITGLFCYPGILFFCWFWVSVNRILNVFGYKNIAILDYFDYTFIGLSGFFNSAFYAYNSIVNRTPIINDIKSFFNFSIQNSNGTLLNLSEQ